MHPYLQPQQVENLIPRGIHFVTATWISNFYWLSYATITFIYYLYSFRHSYLDQQLLLPALCNFCFHLIPVFISSKLPGLATFTTCLEQLSSSQTTCITFVTATWNFHFRSLPGFVLLPAMSNFYFHSLPGFIKIFTSVSSVFTRFSKVFHYCFKSVSKVLQKCFKSVSKLFVCIEVIAATRAQGGLFNLIPQGRK